MTLAIVESQTIVRNGLACLLSGTPDLDCVALEAEHLPAVRQAELRPPDVALLDIAADMPGPGGWQLWKERLPGVRLVLFDAAVRTVNLRLAIQHGLAGYAAKQDSFVDLVELIRRAARGEDAFSPLAQSRMRQTPRGWDVQGIDGEPGLHSLTPREIEVLSHLAQGLTGKQCSQQLGISPSTVDNHKARIMRKLRVRKAVELTRLALREGLLPH